MCPAGERSQHLRGVLLTGLGVLVLTPDSLIIRLIQADAWTLLFWRGIFQFITIIGYFRIRHGGSARAIIRSIGWGGFWISVLYAASNVFFVNAIRETKVANALIILSSSPLLAAVMSLVFLGERIKRRTWVAALVGMVGMGIIFSSGAGGGRLLGDTCALFAAATLGGAFIVIRHQRAINMVPALALSGIFGTIIVAPFASPMTVSVPDVGWLLLIGVFITPVAFGLITLGPRYIPAPEVNLIMLLETILGPVWVWWFLGEVPPDATWVGGVLVVVTLVGHSALALRELRMDARG